MTTDRDRPEPVTVDMVALAVLTVAIVAAGLAYLTGIRP